MRFIEKNTLILQTVDFSDSLRILNFQMFACILLRIYIENMYHAIKISFLIKVFLELMRQNRAMGSDNENTFARGLEIL